MSIDQVSVRPNDTSTTTSTNNSGKDAIKQKTDSQLQQMGLEQARAGVTATGRADVASVSAQNTVGLRVVSSAYAESVSLEQRKPRLPDVEQDKTDTSLFDFEEVAKNVLNFVGGVIRGAAAGGADQSKIESLIDQARSGVSKGVAMARRDLGGLVNDTIDSGINRSESLIEDGIKGLEQELLFDPATQQTSTSQFATSTETDGGLVIRTRDGDEVAVYFGESDAQAISVQESLSRSENGSELARQTQFVSIQQRQFSISVTGDLDQNELSAIGSLVADISELADNFFNGDVESAFQQAVDLGYDRSELAGFALQLNRSESISASSTYSAIQHMGDKESSRGQGPIKRVAEYMEKLESSIARAEQLVEPRTGFEGLVNGLVNQLGLVNTDALVDAINRFHSFNQQLLESYPIGKANSNGDDG